MTPIEAFLLVLTGAMGLYCEFIWPGRFLPALGGSILAALGIHGFTGINVTRTGTTWIGMAVALFLIEAFWHDDFLAGLGGTASLCIGACLLVRGPARIPITLAVPACIFFGCLTVFLCSGAKRARRNKWQDLRRKNEVNEKTELSPSGAVE